MTPSPDLYYVFYFIFILFIYDDCVSVAQLVFDISFLTLKDQGAIKFELISYLGLDRSTSRLFFLLFIILNESKGSEKIFT